MKTPGAELFDAHNHLQDTRLDDARERVLEECRHAGVRAMVVNGTCEADWPRVAELAARHAEILPSYGIHPWQAAGCSPDWHDRLQRQLDARPAAIGEIGLDRWMPQPDLPRQEALFRAQLQLANERRLPVSIHCLQAWGRLLEILQDETPSAGFLLHSYSGSAEMVPRFVQLGACFSISGHFAHAWKRAQQEVFKGLPIDRLLIETDAPDMRPPPARCPYSLANAELNHPANLAAIYAFTAELRGLSPAALTAAVRGNFERLFHGAN